MKWIETTDKTNPFLVVALKQTRSPGTVRGKGKKNKEIPMITYIYRDNIGRMSLAHLVRELIKYEAYNSYSDAPEWLEELHEKRGKLVEEYNTSWEK